MKPKTKPCFICKRPVRTKGGKPFFDWEAVFEAWVDRNRIIAPFRSRFDGVREGLKWAALDETKEGAHAQCALRWIVAEEGYAARYPA